MRGSADVVIVDCAWLTEVKPLLGVVSIVLLQRVCTVVGGFVSSCVVMKKVGASRAFLPFFWVDSKAESATLARPSRRRRSSSFSLPVLVN